MYSSKGISAASLIALAALSVGAFFVSATYAFASGEVITNPVTTGITSSNATLNATNGPTDATGHSFWASLSSFSTASPSLPLGVFSTLDFGAIASSTTFSSALSSVVGLGAITPNTQYFFASWVEYGGTWYPGSVESFTTLATYTLNYTAGAHGSLTGTVSQTVDAGANGTAVTAVADSGYHFVNWSDASTTNPRTDTAVVGNVAVTANFAGSDIYVNDATGNDANDGSSGSPVKTIQHAVDIAISGVTIHVAAGTYAENVTVNKSVTIDGANFGTTGTSTRATESVVDGTNTNAAFAITSSNVTIDGFTVENGANSVASPGALYSGIWVGTGHSNISILNNIVTNNGIGVWAECSSNCLVQGNLFDGNNASNLPGNESISADSTSGLTINSNEFKNDNNGNPINLQGGGSGHASVAITNNYFHGNTNASVIYLISVSTGTITGNIIDAASDVTGISFSGGNSSVQVSGNSITGAARGIRIENPYSVGNNSGITVNSNNLSANTEYAVGNLSGYVGNVDATKNWWGATTGPNATTTPITNAGTGSPAFGNVAYRPWCLESTCASVDVTAPTVSSVTVTPNPANATTVTITVTYSETMNSGTQPTVTLGGLTASPIAATGTFTGAVWTGTATIPANNEDATSTVSVSGAEDQSGNQVVGTDTSATFHVDTIPPVVTSVSYNPTIGTLAIGDELTLTIHADAAGYTAGAITVNGVAVTNFVDAGAGTYTAKYTVVSGNTDRATTAQIPVSVVLTDAAHNSNAAFTTAPSAGTTPGVDANAPAAPSTPDMTAGTDTGSSSTDNLTKNTTPAFSGTAEIGSTVALYDGATQIGSYVTPDGNWTITSTALTPGVHSITAKATDAVGNVGVASAALSITIDTTIPVIAAHLDATVEATSASGATVSYTAPNATDNVDAPAAASCAPASGTVFALGTTTVSCTKNDAAGNSAATTTFAVGVVDTTAPVIAAYANITVEATSASGATVSYTSPATSDAVDGSGTASCIAASGTTFAIGTTTVTCAKVDAHGNAAIQTTFDIGVVDTTAPVIAAHADITVEATSASGATVSYTSPATSDAVDGASTASCTAASGSTFALGTTTVTCSKTDTHSNVATPTTFNVVVRDTTAPVIAASSDVTAEATSASGATVTYTSPTTSDAVDGASTASCTAASGTTFAIGTTTVTCSITDAHNNVATPTTFKVVVRDTTAPIISAHGNLTVEATSATGATVTYVSPTTSDAVDGASTAVCTAASGTVFAIGTTTVNCVKTDAHGNVAAPTSFDIGVVDTTAPVIAAHADVTAEATSNAGATVTYTSATTSDAVDGASTASCSPLSGTVFALGTTTVNCIKTDAHSNVATPTSFSVVVVDTTAPVITVTGSNPDSVFASNSVSYVDAGATATDNYDTSVSVSASGSVNMFNAGTYTITYTATDAAHNTATSTRTVTVLTPGSGGFSGGGGGGGGGRFTPASTPANGTTGGTISGTTGGQVLGANTYNFTKNLRRGASGNDVVELQKILIAEGFLKIPSPTGYFGGLTEAAVKAYQKAHGVVPQSGYVGPLTRVMLNKGANPTT